MLSLRRSFYVLMGCWLLVACSSPPAEQTTSAPLTLRVAAAADLRYALDSLVAVFGRQQPGVTVQVTYGSSGKFYEQLRHGAPFDVFFSADSDYPQQLHAQHLTAAAPVPYATGQLVLWSRTIDPRPRGMQTLLDARVKKIALANPAHAPYGRKAEEALRHYQLYDQLRPRLVFGENIAQTANYAATGSADAGLIALALALSPELRKQGQYFVVPPAAYSPLQQSFVVLKNAAQPAAAAQFATFVGSEPARAVLRVYGFTLPR